MVNNVECWNCGKNYLIVMQEHDSCPVCKSRYSEKDKYRIKKDSEKTPADLLHESAEVFEQRNKLYGDNYRRFGAIMKLLFPSELVVATADDWNRLGLLVQTVAKQTRYCENFNKGGHDDSLCDLSVYAAMLRKIDQEMNEIPF